LGGWAEEGEDADEDGLDIKDIPERTRTGKGRETGAGYATRSIWWTMQTRKRRQHARLSLRHQTRQQVPPPGVSKGSARALVWGRLKSPPPKTIR